MDSDFKRRLERLEQPAAVEAKSLPAIEARARVGRQVDKLITWLRRGKPVDSFGSPVPNDPAEPSPARDKLIARLEKMAQAIETP